MAISLSIEKQVIYISYENRDKAMKIEIKQEKKGGRKEDPNRVNNINVNSIFYNAMRKHRISILNFWLLEISSDSPEPQGRSKETQSNLPSYFIPDEGPFL